ncbi:MAG TPA: M23 family metallopeptidase [Pyrinomonadaceae bacterium]
MYSPSPCSLFSRHHLPFTNIFQRTGFATTVALALFFLVLNTSFAAAQTRARRTRTEPEKSSKRVDDKKISERVDDKRRAPVVETARRDNGKQVVANPLVRKTSLTYVPQRESQTVKRPVLVNDITVASRVGEKPAPTVRLTSATRVVGGPSNIPSIWPVMGTLRSGLGTRSNPFGGSSIEFHKGQDIAAPIGTPVIATADGTVTIAGWQRGYGWVVYIDHGNGISTRYGHLSRIDVAAGQTIKRGEQLGLVGSTGRSTGPHLHYEVRINGQPVSPLLYLPQLTSPISAQRENITNPGAQR